MRIRALSVLCMLISCFSSIMGSEAEVTVCLNATNTGAWEVSNGVLKITEYSIKKVIKISSTGISKGTDSNNGYLRWVKENALNFSCEDYYITQITLNLKHNNSFNNYKVSASPNEGLITTYPGTNTSDYDGIEWKAPKGGKVSALDLYFTGTVYIHEIIISYIPKSEEPQSIGLTASVTKSEDISEEATVSCQVDKADVELFWALEPLTVENVGEKGNKVTLTEDENAPGTVCAQWTVPAIEDASTAEIHLLAMNVDGKYTPVTHTLQITYDKKHCRSIDNLPTDGITPTVLHLPMTVTTVTSSGDVFLETGDGSHLLMRRSEDNLQLPKVGDKSVIVCGIGFNLAGIIGIETSQAQWDETGDPTETPTEVIVNEISEIQNHYGHEVTINGVKLYTEEQQMLRRLSANDASTFTVTEATDPTQTLKVISPEASTPLESGITYNLRGVPVKANDNPIFYQTGISKVKTALESVETAANVILTDNKLTHNTPVTVYDAIGRIYYQSRTAGTTTLPCGVYILTTPSSTRKLIIP